MRTINSARNLMQVVRELSLDDLRDEAERPPRILVLANALEDADAVAETLTGEFRSPYVTAMRLDAPIDRYDTYEAIIVFDPEARRETRVLIDSIEKRSRDIVIMPFLSLDPGDERTAEQLRNKILNRLSQRATAFGRHFPAFAGPAVRLVIDETSVANAQFALIANVPAVVPLVGSLATATADLIVLTKNQLLLVFKIAAIHGRDLDDRAGIMREMLPVGGAGFLWRTLAREATTFLPLAAGTIPKVAIAYSGTYAIGRAADYFYRFGERPSKDTMKSFYRTAMESLKRREFPFRNARTVEAEFQVLEDEELELDDQSNGANPHPNG
jgi:uncharacterized protein (DUF697 family)